MKGIILAGGRATRLYPITKVVCKQLLPLYDKPMIYYPLSTLMQAGIRDVLIISTPYDLPRIKELFLDGKEIGINISYAEQAEPKGIADAFVVGKEFIGNEKVCLILGDNIFYGNEMSEYLKEAMSFQQGAAIFGYYVKDPERYGVIEFDQAHNVVSIEEKPKQPKSHWVATGLYVYDNEVVNIASNLAPSQRGELEITDVNNVYLSKKQLKVKLLGRGYAWLDTGTYDSLIDASVFIKTIEERQGLKIGCVEEIAYRMGYIDKEQVKNLAKKINTDYGNYLRSIIT
ncbi:MAG: glucose-1-phosphate thymidylyltransferase RfbA [PVC group bacterium]|nr:glucose-1-phosphate thymidylyltransferase RfbA [PVC group bacterium]